MIIIIVLLIISLLCNIWCIKSILDNTHSIGKIYDIIDIFKDKLN